MPTDTADRGAPGAAGFTLIELMIVIALVGILAATAITSFVGYQNRSKRAEAVVNVESIRKVQLAYEAEFSAFVSALPSPAGSLSNHKRNWAAGGGRFYAGPVGQGFELLGWRPEGGVFFDYDTVAAVGADGPAFTAAAYGDVDGDGLVSVFLFVYPDGAGGTLDCTLCGSVVSHTGPPLDADGNPVVNRVQQLMPPAADDF